MAGVPITDGYGTSSSSSKVRESRGRSFTVTPRTARPCLSYSWCSAMNSGISALQGRHHEAQKFMRIALVLSSCARVSVSPLSVSSAKSGAGRIGENAVPSEADSGASSSAREHAAKTSSTTTRNRRARTALPPLVESVAEAAVHEPRDDEVGRVEGLDRRELHHVHSHHALLLEHLAQEVEGLVPEPAARLGGAGRRHDRRVEEIDVEGQVDVVRERREGSLDPAVAVRDPVGPEDGDVAVADEVGLLDGKGADSHRHDLRNAELEDAAHDAGVRPRRVLVHLAQVSVGVELEDRQ